MLVEHALGEPVLAIGHGDEDLDGSTCRARRRDLAAFAFLAEARGLRAHHLIANLELLSRCNGGALGLALGAQFSPLLAQALLDRRGAVGHPSDGAFPEPGALWVPEHGVQGLARDSKVVGRISDRPAFAADARSKRAIGAMACCLRVGWAHERGFVVAR